jgi:hypothetical protein
MQHGIELPKFFEKQANFRDRGELWKKYYGK